MKLSCIIPTHNRSASLKRTLESLLSIIHEADAEIVVVNNNCTDDTPDVVRLFGTKVRHVFEERTAFTRARARGRQEAKGDILLYLDDDVIVQPGSLREVCNVFDAFPNCGVLAGRIEPLFEVEPPDWVKACQLTFNGLSIYSPSNMANLGTGFQEVGAAIGPMMAIRSSVYDQVGGFPPDTIGVETNISGKTFRKLYVGPGDYGLCHKVRTMGGKVYYSPKASCFHVIPPFRCKISFWRSRMIGEGQHAAITNRMFFKKSKISLILIRSVNQKRFIDKSNILREYYKKQHGEYKQFAFSEGMHPAEIYFQYAKSYLEMDSLLEKYPDLGPYLWDIASQGVADANFSGVINRLPAEFKDIILDENYYDNIAYSADRLPPSVLAIKGKPRDDKIVQLTLLLFGMLSKTNKFIRARL